MTKHHPNMNIHTKHHSNMKKTLEKHQKQNKKRELPGCERIVSDKGGWLLGQGKSTIHQVCAKVLNDLSSGK